MGSPFRDDVAAAKDELAVLEYEQRELRRRITELKRRVDRSPQRRGVKAATFGGIAFACLGIAVIVTWWVALMSISSRRPKNEAALVGARRIAASTDLFFATSCSGDCPRCPSVDDLIASKVLDRRMKDDPWGSPYRIVCSSDENRWVHSVGKDGILHTADDIMSDMPESNLKTLDELSK